MPESVAWFTNTFAERDLRLACLLLLLDCCTGRLVAYEGMSRA